MLRASRGTGQFKDDPVRLQGIQTAATDAIFRCKIERWGFDPEISLFWHAKFGFRVQKVP